MQLWPRFRMPISLAEEDLIQLHVLYPELDFADTHRKNALLYVDTVDIQAAPGSGKTTLLGAKLALIAAKWPHPARGICVLSHTNVAREEIEARLRASPAGERLLSYPHFVGTIQSFVHMFLALPYLRSIGVEVDIIDDEAFADRAIRWAQNHPVLRVWADSKPYQRRPTIETLRIEGPELSVNCVRGELPSVGTKSRAALEAMKGRLIQQGIFRYDDMLSLAENLLTDWPAVADALSTRFPLVFIDEMQDTNAMQESLLASIFRDKSVVQRYGDINQSILNVAPGGNTFPRPGYLNLPSSKRFGSEFSDIANSLRHAGAAISGDGLGPACPITLLLYTDTTIQQVLPSFASLVSNVFTSDELLSGTVKAICARKQGGKKETTGSNIAEYYPAYDAKVGSPVAARQSVYELVLLACTGGESAPSRAPQVAAARLAIVRCLQLADAAIANNAKTWRNVLDTSAELNLDALPLHRLAQKLIVEPQSVDTQDKWVALVELVFQHLKSYFSPSLTRAEFAAHSELAFVPAVAEPNSASQSNVISFAHGKQPVEVYLSTTAGSKGETHLATLVMESFYKPSFDFTSALPFLCGEADATAVSDANLRRHLLNLFVAATRPRRMLCFTAHRDRISDAYVTKLKERGWVIMEC